MRNSTHLHKSLMQMAFANPPGTSLVAFRSHYAEAVFTALGKLSSSSMPNIPSDRLEWAATQLLSSRRRQSPGGAECEAEAVVDLLRTMVPGGENDHLRRLLRWADTKGAHVWLAAGQAEQLQQTIPYPACAWKWKFILSYKWAAPQHINVLDLASYLIFVRRKSRSSCFQCMRYVNAFDSQVASSVVAKGRSSSQKLNRPRRRLIAYELAMDVYLVGVWTISAW